MVEWGLYYPIDGGHNGYEYKWDGDICFSNEKVAILFIHAKVNSLNNSIEEDDYTPLYKKSEYIWDNETTEHATHRLMLRKINVLDKYKNQLLDI